MKTALEVAKDVLDPYSKEDISDCASILAKAVVQLTEDLEKSGRAIGEVIAGFTKTEEGLREDLARRFDKIKRVCELNDNQSQAMKEAEAILTDCAYNEDYEAQDALDWLAKYGEKK